MRLGRHGAVELGSEEGKEDVWEVELLTLDAWVQTAMEEEACHDGNRTADLAGVGEGNGLACSTAGLSFRFLARGCRGR